MPNLYMERKQLKREELRATAKNILDAAATEDRDVNDAERKAVEEHYRAIAEIDEELKPLHAAELRQAETDKQRAELARASASVTAQHTGGGGSQIEYYRSRGVGQYLADWGRKTVDGGAAHRVMRAQAEYRVVADQLLADNPGIVPTPIVGPAVGTLPTRRPYIDSVANRPLPAGGSSFNRPRITQHTAVGLQATEKTQLASQKMTITSLPVAKQTYGGTLDISFQDRDWTDPAILAIAVADLEQVYADVTDNAAADYFVGAITDTFVLADSPAEGATRAAILTAASEVFANTKRAPDTVWASPDMFATLAAITLGGSGGAGGQAFAIGDATGVSGSLLGLRVVVDGNFAPGTLIVGVSSLAEHYEQVGGRLAVTEPTILGYTIAYYGYVADIVVEPGGFLKRVAA